jgi:hypothetical protein
MYAIMKKRERGAEIAWRERERERERELILVYIG